MIETVFKPIYSPSTLPLILFVNISFLIDLHEINNALATAYKDCKDLCLIETHLPGMSLTVFDLTVLKERKRFELKCFSNLQLFQIVSYISFKGKYIALFECII